MWTGLLLWAPVRGDEPARKTDFQTSFTAGVSLLFHQRQLVFLACPSAWLDKKSSCLASVCYVPCHVDLPVTMFAALVKHHAAALKLSYSDQAAGWQLQASGTPRSQGVG